MRPRLSVVAPVYNEAAILPELARRCLAAAQVVDPHAQVLLVDDGSTDDTRAVAATLSGVQVVHLPHNQGQLRATLEGLARAHGQLVVVLDGDLQDPPEQIEALAAAMASTEVDVVFAAKTRRHDPLWFRMGRGLYGLVQRMPLVRGVPPGAGAYCIMRRPLAQRVARISLAQGNLAAVLVALGASHASIPYDKAPRYDEQSRVGPMGLAIEAIASLLLTGALAMLAAPAMLVVSVVVILLDPGSLPLAITLMVVTSGWMTLTALTALARSGLRPASSDTTTGR